ncbi:MAG TPA: flavodoxin domain-containing protein [Gemmatimonadaceae bacterium]|nr:flavodoxin domain-containing protein [Gemmatimonadaceae bacterium]
MKRLAVLYTTREGQTRRIAERVGAVLRARGFTVDVIDIVRELPSDFDPARYAGAILASSIHIGKHEPAMLAFVKKWRTELELIPSTFLSVSLSQAGAVDAKAPPARRESAKANVEKMIAEFLQKTRWRPLHVYPVAGALLYRQYSLLLRLVMRFIAKVAGASTDTSRDHEYTDWKTVERYAEELASEVRAAEAAIRVSPRSPSAPA